MGATPGEDRLAAFVWLESGATPDEGALTAFEPLVWLELGVSPDEDWLAAFEVRRLDVAAVKDPAMLAETEFDDGAANVLVAVLNIPITGVVPAELFVSNRHYLNCDVVGIVWK